MINEETITRILFDNLTVEIGKIGNSITSAHINVDSIIKAAKAIAAMFNQRDALSTGNPE